MSKEVILENLKANEIMEIVRELRESGLVQGTDFDFRYNQTQYDYNGWEVVSPQHTAFIFYKDKYATFFTIKYGSNKT